VFTSPLSVLLICYFEAINLPIIAEIGFNVLLVGSTATPKFSKAVAPNKNNESFAAKATGYQKLHQIDIIGS